MIFASKGLQSWLVICKTPSFFIAPVRTYIYLVALYLLYGIPNLFIYFFKPLYFSVTKHAYYLAIKKALFSRVLKFSQD
jgi:hypothetical protein